MTTQHNIHRTTREDERAVRNAMLQMQVRRAFYARNRGALPTDVRRCEWYGFNVFVDAALNARDRADRRLHLERMQQRDREIYVAAALRLEAQGRTHLDIRGEV